jgi:hypothetical protein
LVVRTGAESENSARLWGSELEAWPTSKLGSIISLFVRHVKQFQHMLGGQVSVNHSMHRRSGHERILFERRTTR